MVLPENSLVLKTQILRLADIKAFDVICFINEHVDVMKQAVMEMAEDSCIMQEWQKKVSILKRKQTWMVYLESGSLISHAELCDFFECLQKGDFDTEKEQKQ